jgi:hypothetical protein
VTVGHAFTLTIVAANQNSGRPLGYQWRKEATAIAGAVQSTYNKSAELTDAGNYDVLVTNDGGTLTSMSVAVAIDPAPPTAEPPSSGGGCCSVSGGDWSTGALGLLVAGLLGSPRRRRRGQ